MKHLSAVDIQQNLRKKNEQRKECFNKLLEKCYVKIEKASNMNKPLCIYDIPEFLLGYPLYNLNECITYLYNALINQGFTVHYIFPKILVVTWNTPHLDVDSPVKSTGCNKKKKNNIALHNNQLLQIPHQQNTPTGFVKSIKQFKPSGKFVLDLS